MQHRATAASFVPDESVDPLPAEGVLNQAERNQSSVGCAHKVEKRKWKQFQAGQAFNQGNAYDDIHADDLNTSGEVNSNNNSNNSTLRGGDSTAKCLFVQIFQEEAIRRGCGSQGRAEHPADAPCPHHPTLPRGVGGVSQGGLGELAGAGNGQQDPFPTTPTRTMKTSLTLFAAAEQGCPERRRCEMWRTISSLRPYSTTSTRSTRTTTTTATTMATLSKVGELNVTLLLPALL